MSSRPARTPSETPWKKRKKETDLTNTNIVPPKWYQVNEVPKVDPDRELSLSHQLTSFVIIELHVLILQEEQKFKKEKKKKL